MASFQELCKSCKFFFFHFWSHIATVRACNCNGNNISEINCQTGVRSNVLFEQEGGWMEVVSIYWTVSQLLGQFLRAPSSQGLIHLVIYLCLCLYLLDNTLQKKRDQTTHCKKMWRRTYVHNCWSASRVNVKGWDQSSKLLLSSPSTSSHYTASSKQRGVCLKLCTWLEN